MISVSSFNSLPPFPLLPRSRRCCRCFPCTRFFPAPLHSFTTPLPFSKIKYSSNSSAKYSAVRVLALNSAEEGSNDNGEGEYEYRVVTAINSSYNEIVIIDTPKSRILILDSTHNVHSIVNKEEKWTGSYWDEFATLPAIVPKGPIAILGLGAGTAAHLMLDVWPSLQLEGWEIDEILIDKVREYFSLSDLEKHTQDGGVLHVHIGDALSPSITIPGGYAGIVVDLFSDGKVLPQLQEVKTWLELNDKLMPNGRLMVNCGGADDEASNSTIESTWEQVSTLKAISKAFPGQLSWKKMQRSDGENYLALTGPFPDLTTWSAALPDRLSSCVMQWRT